MTQDAKTAPVEIVRFEPWMIPGMADLHAREYGTDVGELKGHFAHCFASDFARQSGAIAVVGLSDRRVVAVQTYIPWPYVRSGRELRSIQSGATLVSPEFRGRKLFQRMLAEGTRIASEDSVDFLMGFPVPMSHGGFIKDGWTDIGRLRWWTRPLRPIKLARQRWSRNAAAHLPALGRPLDIATLAAAHYYDDRFHLATSTHFLRWRYRPEIAERYRIVECHSSRGSVVTTLKVYETHGFREIVIGSLRGDVDDALHMIRAFRDMLQEAVRDLDAAAITMAVLRPPASLRAALLATGFIPHRQLASLIVKPIRPMPGLTDPTLWRGVSSEDIDAW